MFKKSMVISILALIMLNTIAENLEDKCTPFLVDNYNFENGKNGKIEGWKAPIARSGEQLKATWINSDKDENKHFVQLEVKHFSGRTIPWKSNKFEVTPGETLKGSIMVKVENIVTSGHLGDGCKGIVHFFAKKGKYLRNRQLFTSSKNHDWKKFTFSVKVPPEAAYAYVVLGALKSKGTFSFDNIKVAEGEQSSTLILPTTLNSKKKSQ